MLQTPVDHQLHSSDQTVNVEDQNREREQQVAVMDPTLEIGQYIARLNRIYGAIHRNIKPLSGAEVYDMESLMQRMDEVLQGMERIYIDRNPRPNEYLPTQSH